MNHNNVKNFWTDDVLGFFGNIYGVGSGRPHPTIGYCSPYDHAQS
jgi:hypothetical protein